MKSQVFVSFVSLSTTKQNCIYYGRDIWQSQPNHVGGQITDVWKILFFLKSHFSWTTLSEESNNRSTRSSRFVCLAMLISRRCNAVLMSLAYVAISQWAGNLSLLPLPWWPGWRFNFVEVLADYRYLGAAVMENAAQAGSEREAGTLIRTAVLGRFPRGEQWDRASKDTLDVRWKHQDHPHCSILAGIQVLLIIW